MGNSINIKNIKSNCIIFESFPEIFFPDVFTGINGNHINKKNEKHPYILQKNINFYKTIIDNVEEICGKNINEINKIILIDNYCENNYYQNNSNKYNKSKILKYSEINRNVEILFLNKKGNTLIIYKNNIPENLKNSCKNSNGYIEGNLEIATKIFSFDINKLQITNYKLKIEN